MSTLKLSSFCPPVARENNFLLVIINLQNQNYQEGLDKSWKFEEEGKLTMNGEERNFI